MGFGSYDESEQQNQEISGDDDGERVDVHGHEHDGEMTFESEASADDLIDQLGEIKSNSDDE